MESQFADFISTEGEEGNIWLRRDAAKLRDLTAQRISRSQKAEPLDKLFSYNGKIQNPETLSIATYKKMLKDSTIQAAFNVIKNAVKSRGFHMSGGDPVIREWEEKMIREISLDKIIDNLLLGYIYGFSANEMEFDLVENTTGKGPSRIWKWIDIVHIPAEQTEFKANPKGEVEWVYQNTSFRNPKKINAGKCIIYTYNQEDSNPYGYSVLRSIYKLWQLKNAMLRYWSLHMELAGGAIRTMNAGNMPLDTALSYLKSMKTGAALVHGPDQEIRIHFPPAGQTQYRDILNYCDSGMTKGLGVPTLLMGQSTEFGSRSLSETHFALFKLALVTFLQNEMKSTIEKKLKNLVDINWGQQESYATILFNSWSTMDLEQLANVYSKLAKIGIIGMNDNEKVRERMELWGLPDGGLGDFYPVVGEKSIGLETDNIESPKRENNQIT